MSRAIFISKEKVMPAQPAGNITIARFFTLVIPKAGIVTAYSTLSIQCSLPTIFREASTHQE